MLNTNAWRLGVAILLSATLTGAGWVVAFRSVSFFRPVVSQSTADAVAELTTGIDGRVGWGTFGVAAIPLTSIYGNDSQRIAKQVVRRRLQDGYRGGRGHAGPSADAPVLAHGSPYEWL